MAASHSKPSTGETIPGKQSGEALVIRETSFSEDAARVLAFLEQHGTFHFPSLKSGLFSAAVGDGEELAVTGYRSVWVRDNVHIAHAHWIWGDVEKATQALRALLSYFIKHRRRFDQAIARQCDINDPMQRPHIRFDGERLEELDEKWSHAQNDALGGLLWLSSLMATAGVFQPNTEEARIMASLAAYLHLVEYWQDEDSGHWEEVRKIAASSIGVATAASERYREWLSQKRIDGSRPPASDLVTKLCHEGRSQLDVILPWECRQPDPAKQRRYDSALLFLIYPYRIVDDATANAIVSDVTTNLLGDHGIKRYLGDSYWCADYKEKLSAEIRTSDFSDNIDARNSLLEPNAEAQWCLFDPIVAIHFGLRHEKTNSPEDRRLQMRHLNRSLGQLTNAGSPVGPYRCPESYYRSKGQYVHNDICPLLWTQANLKLALWHASGKPLIGTSRSQ